MRKKLLGLLLIMVFCLGVPTLAAASSIGFTGDPAADSWVRQGNSLTLGTFIRGTGPMNFDVYSAGFYLDASSPLAGGHWQAGDLILGLGLVSQGGTQTDDYYHDPRMVAKFGTTAASFAPSSYMPPLPPPSWSGVQGDGHGSFSTYAGTGGVQVDFEYQLTNGTWDPNGTGPNQSGVIQTAIVRYYDGTQSLILSGYGKVLGIFPEDQPGHFIDQSFEVALDVSYLMRDGYSPVPSLTGKADLAWQVATGNYTDAYVPNVGANVPVPGTLLLLSSGLIGLGLLRQKKNNQG